MAGKRPWALLAVAIAAVSTMVAWPRRTDAPALPLVAVTIGNVRLQAEVASNPDAQARGLSGRTALPDGKAMLFPFAAGSQPSFWMQGMRFPLDFIWIAENMVAEITANVPVAVAGQPLPTYRPQRPVSAMLEVPGGFSARRGIRVGDAVAIEGWGSP